MKILASSAMYFDLQNTKLALNNFSNTETVLAGYFNVHNEKWLTFS